MTRPKFLYHGSARPLEVGATYRAEPIANKTNAARLAAEKLFESKRPKSKPSRLTSFFLVDNPEDLVRAGATSTKHIYRVKPIGPLHRGDFEWLWRAGSYEMDCRYGVSAGGAVGSPHWTREDQAFVNGLISNYWKGKSLRGFFEWHAHSMKIVEDLSGRRL